MVEQWHPIPGWDDLYEASTEGRIRSLDRIDNLGRKRTGKMLSPGTHSGGHLTVNLHRNGKAHSHLVHRLVMSAFVGPCPPGLEVCHWDGDNQLDMVRHGTHPQASKTHCAQGHLFTADNTYQRPEGGRTCRACQRRAVRAHRLKRKANA